MNRSSSAVAGSWLCAGSASAAHRPPARSPGPSTVASRPAADVGGHREADRERDALRAPGLLERGRVALEDALLRLGDAELAQHAGDHALARRRGRAEQPGQLPGAGGGQRPVRGGVVRGDHREHLVVQERLVRQLVRHVGRHRAEGDVHGAGREQGGELRAGPDAQLHVEVVRTAREQLDEARGGVLGEDAGRRHPQQPPAVAGLADLADGAVLQAEDLDRPARQPQPAGGERQPGRRTREELVVELAAQLGDVHRDRRLAHLQLVGRRLDRAQPHHGGEGAQLGGGHVRTSRTRAS